MVPIILVVKHQREWHVLVPAMSHGLSRMSTKPGAHVRPINWEKGHSDSFVGDNLDLVCWEHRGHGK